MPAVHAVSCKAALFSPDGEQVLLMQLKYIGPQAYGLPGGHAEVGENPDKAMRRELHEKTGLQDVPLARKDFWQHEGGKIILGFAGRLATLDLPPPPKPECEVAVWVDLRAIARDEVSIGSYKEFVLHSASQVALHPVSCKVAIYSPKGDAVLLMHYPQRAHYGLPGGHLEKDELPEQALQRELVEELGAAIVTTVHKRDFWVHHTGKIVLGFVATANTTELPSPPNPNRESGEWVPLNKLHTINVESWRDFIVKNQPTA